ncbi:hypothetical protein N7490_000811 [Penicillium lividum]|nr:hypothetical protein N7490_000811 [Penicillium lividum]
MDGYSCESTTTSPCARLGDSTSTVRKLDFRSPRRVWESTSKSKYNRGLYFDIREDTSGKMSPDPRSPGSYTDLGEDKENLFAIGSDNHSSMEPDTEDENIDYDRLTDHRDAFGFVIPYADALSELPVSEEGHVARPVPFVLNPPVPTETVRPVIRMGIQMRDEDEDSVEQWGTWEDTLNPDQIRELRRLSDVFIRESLQREARSRQYPMRDYEDAQGSANIFMEARHSNEYQRHQIRRRASEGDGA